MCNSLKKVPYPGRSHQCALDLFTSLTIDNSYITALKGYNVNIIVNGVKKEINTRTTYIGNIILSLSKKSNLNSQSQAEGYQAELR
jgi:hypothetical protein